MTRYAEIQQMSDAELQALLVQLKREQLNLRFQAATRQLEKPARIREVRRTIARIETERTRRARQAKD
ncbi:MAG: 50S ribosomal protein L29 [Sphingomonadaceae bacterium]|uniref:50S ribosomal protein L29 n=1 Tax=Thermaurantiacus sp. TaxID=2820283 RepID=UPI00298EED08|nr:50S ribosomal protein L29 [Thermaurantiacus sp.]MCS6986433.1 50S ribosomal protein L29 [Sphingomonadaceae bacterium]MDW8414306.1 50S ribosomal protein L29 [Thermaurantiacus sp.]